MKFKCAHCNKNLILGHDQKYELGIKFTDGAHQDIFVGKPKRQFKWYCEDCRGKAYEKYEALITIFNKENIP